MADQTTQAPAAAPAAPAASEPAPPVTTQQMSPKQVVAAAAARTAAAAPAAPSQAPMSKMTKGDPLAVLCETLQALREVARGEAGSPMNQSARKWRQLDRIITDGLCELGIEQPQPAEAVAPKQNAFKASPYKATPTRKQYGRDVPSRRPFGK